MKTDISKEIKKTSQLHHCFYIHKEYINYDQITYDDINEKPGSFYHPHFINLKELGPKLDLVFPNIIWSHFKEFELEDNFESVSFGKVKTEYGVIILQFNNEIGEVYSPIYVSVELTDYPFIELKKLCKEYGWFLYHINSFSYLDVWDDNQIEDDFISST